MPPAAFAFGGAGFGEGGGDFTAGLELEFAEDEEFFQLVEAGGPTRQLGRVGEMQGDDGFQIVRDDFFGAGFFQGLRDDAAELEKAVAFGKGGGVGGARGGE